MLDLRTQTGLAGTPTSPSFMAIRSLSNCTRINSPHRPLRSPTKSCTPKSLGTGSRVRQGGRGAGRAEASSPLGTGSNLSHRVGRLGLGAYDLGLRLSS